MEEQEPEKKSKPFWGLLLILCIIVVVLLADRSRLKSNTDSALSLARTEIKAAAIWKNKHGLSQAKASAAETNIGTFKKLYGDSLRDLHNQIHGLNRSLSNLHSLVAVSSKTDLQINTEVRDTAVTLPDSTTTTKRVASYHDAWTNASVIFGEDSAEWKLSFRDSLVLASYWERPKFWKERKLFVEGITYNPHTKFTGLRQVAITQPKNKFVVGPFVGITVTGKPTLGIGLTYKLFSF